MEGFSSSRSNPPKTILDPPPPPAPPPPATRSIKASPSGRTTPPSSLGPPPAPTRSPPCMGAPVVPQHRNEVLHKMLKGLEDDSLTVADVLGVLETELRSGAPAAAPLSEQFERYIGPLADVSGPPISSKPISSQPLRGSSPNPLVAPSFPFAGGSTPRSRLLEKREEIQQPQQHILVNCARCAVLEQQVKALAQSLSGLGARMFNWSLAHCKENNERNGLWHLIVKYLEPVATVDSRISETCTGLQAACGTSGATHIPTDNFPARQNHNRSPGIATVASSPAPPLPAWQPPGINASIASAMGLSNPDTTTAGSRPPVRFAENPLHQRAPGVSPSQSSTASSPSTSFPPYPDQKVIKATPSSPSSPKAIAGFGPSAEGMTVRFVASSLATKLNGYYVMLPGLRINERPVYALGRRHILHLNDGTWAVKDGPEDDVEADVYAYVKDAAWEPHRILHKWNVAADGDGFILDTQGAVAPNRCETAEVPDDAALRAARLANMSAASTHESLVAKQSASNQDLESAHAAAWRDMPQNRLPAAPLSVPREPDPYTEEQGTAELRITIVKAQRLRVRDDVTSQVQPYVVCELPSKGSLGKTAPVPYAQVCSWNHELMTKYVPGDRMKFTVWCQGMASGPELLGEATLKSERFFPHGFRGELALKDVIKDKRATLAIRIDVLSTSSASHAAAEAPERPLPVLAQPSESSKKNTSTELFELQDRLDAAAARERTLQQQLDMESRARLSAEKEAAALHHAAHDYLKDDDDEEEYHQEYFEDDEDIHDDPELEYYRKAFHAFDKADSGSILLSDLQAVMDSIQRSFSDAELRILMQKVSRNNSVDFHDFLVLIDELNAAEEDAGSLGKYQAMFDRAQSSRKGTISLDELASILDATGKSCDPAKVKSFACTTDDEGLTLPDFMKLMEQLECGSLAPNAAKVAASQQSKLVPSDRKRIKAFLKRKGFPEHSELAQAANQQRKTGSFMKKGFEYPLHTASVENNHDMVWLLLQSGADSGHKNSDGKTAFEAAQRADNGRGSHSKVLELLLHAENSTGGGDEAHF